MPSEAAHDFMTSGSTETTATKVELKLSPIKHKKHQQARNGLRKRRKRRNTHMLNIFLTIYKALCHKIAFDIYIFYLLWSNVLALCQLKDIFLPTMK